MIENKVEILLAQRDIGISDILIQNTCALIIEGKIEVTNKFFHIDNLEIVAQNYAERMISKCYLYYSIVNGERIRFSNYERIKTRCVSADYIEMFQKAIDKRLKERK